MERARGKHDGQTVCLSIYSITENIYYSQLSSVALLLQPKPVSHRIIQGMDWVLSPYVLSPCGLPLPPTYLLVTVNEIRSYFASTTMSGLAVLSAVKKYRQITTSRHLASCCRHRVSWYPVAATLDSESSVVVGRQASRRSEPFLKHRVVASRNFHSLL
jgi:hypothetical protein